MAQLGFRTIDEMIGQVDALNMKKAVDHWKAKALDLSDVIYQPDVPSDFGKYAVPWWYQRGFP